MLHFDCDYMEGACPEILDRLLATNLEQTPGYGADGYSRSARERIRQACGQADAAVHFLVGGTQTNATVIDALLRRHEGVVCADTGHINVHEAGAIEASGHKVLALPGRDGKLPAAALKACLDAYAADDTREHMVAPGAVYVSLPTELGTLYSLAELEELAALCRGAGIPLYLDGARLGYGLAAPGTDVTLRDVARLCDVFYIGGTKVGALFGEAVVAPRPQTLPHFFSLVKQHGALLAKGRLLSSPTASICAWAATPWSRRSACAKASPPAASCPSWTRPQTNSSSACPTRSSTACCRRLPSSTGARAARRSRPCAS